MALRPLAVALLALTGLLWTSEARADVFTVTSTSDAPGPVGCIALQCPTLRAAIAAATNNGATSDDEIVVPAGTIELVQGTLTVSSRVTIRGLGATRTIIRPNIEFPDRPLTVPSGAIVTLRDLTVRSGRPTSGVGGNVQVNNSATLTMTRVRVFDGRAQMGGGIGALGPTALTISQSLIDGNTATGTALTDIGGGLYLQGQTSATAVSITDSTIVSNSAVNGPAVGIVNNAAQTPSFVGVTMTRNDARPGANGTGIGGIFSQNTSARFAGSIVGGNTRTVNLGGGQSVTPSNCGLATPAIDDGGNVSPDQQDMCGLGGEHRDPLLPDELDGSEPPALAIPADSPAVDIADCGGRTVDQRGVARPQLGGCDAGAYEYQPPPPEPTPTPTPTPPVVVPTPTPTATPTPVAGRSVGVQPSGRVLVKLRGSRTFVPLGEGVLDNGAEVDTRDGAVVITRTDGGRARFFDGIFRISHSRGITTLTLTEQLAPCSSKARTAQKRKPKTRRLWGDGKGKFRTKGRYSAATVRGTKWLVTDGCRFTRTRVTQGSVLVRDSVRKRNIVVRKGKTYVARPRR